MRFPRKAATYTNDPGALAIAGGYAVVVLGVAVFVATAGGLAGVWLVLVTLPSSLLVQFVPADGTVFLICLTLGGLAQAWLLWLALRGRRRSDLRPR